MKDDALDLIAVQQAVVAIAKGAGQILLDRFGHVAAHRKTDGTLVTDADHAADRYITSALLEHFPQHAILSEERNTQYSPTASYTWVVDPLDGTTNYARGLHLFGVSIALLLEGMPVVGCLDFPCLHETYSAVIQGGAFCNSELLATDPTARPDDQQFLMQCTRTPRRYTIHSPLKPRILGSAAYHIASVANGTALAAVEATPKVWDLAAAYLILLEAGGSLVGLHKDPIFPLAPTALDYQGVSMPILAAANQVCLETIRKGMESR